MRKNLVVLGLIGAFVVGSATAVLAAHLTNYPLRHSTTGAQFGNSSLTFDDGYINGRWEWYAATDTDLNGIPTHGGFHFWGRIYDTLCSDGDNVYSKVAVAGYAPLSFYGTLDANCSDGQPSKLYQNYEVWDPQALYTTTASYNVCRDRSFPYSDNCSTTQTMSRV